MILMTTTSDLVRLITSASGNIDVHASYVDRNGSTITGGRQDTLITTATTTTIVPQPGSGTTRNVKSLTIRNRHATTSNAVTVVHSDGTNIPELIKVTLAAQEQLIYDDDEWIVIDAAGGRRIFAQAGLHVGTTFLTAGTTFTTGPRTNKIRLRMVGGGGGGGGCTSVAAAAAAAGGGGAGAFAEKDFAVTPNTAYTYAIGALGAGGSAADGSNGGNTTFAVGATTVTAPGGSGGKNGVALTTLVAYAGGAGGAVATNGDVNAGGSPGEAGVTLIVATPIVASGAGGSGPLGAGGLGLAAVGNGNAGIGFGSGGSGSATGASTSRTGGNGTAGAIIVEEYT